MPERHLIPPNPDGSDRGHVDASARLASGSYVSDTAAAFDCVVMHDRSALQDDAQAGGHAIMFAGALGEGRSVIGQHAQVWGHVREEARVGGTVAIHAGSDVFSDAIVIGDAVIPQGAEVGHQACIVNRYGYAHGLVGGETWDAYTCWNEHAGWYVAMRFACKRLALSCWKKEENVAAQARDVGYHKQAYWQEAIEHAVVAAEAAIIIPTVLPSTLNIPQRREIAWTPK